MLTFEQQLVRGFWIGLLSAVLSDVIILCLLLIQKPSPKKINQEIGTLSADIGSQ